LSALTELLGSIERCRAIDLAQPYFTGMPHYPLHSPYLYSLSKKHGEIVNPGGSSSAADFAITPEHLDRASQGLSVQSGDVVLLRTGWSRYSQVHSPGPGLEGARWLSERKIFAAGSETAPFEFVPNPSMSVHVHLLVESGIHIIECLNLEELAACGAREFLFVATPLRIRGGTASPIRPIALVPALVHQENSL
jgi:kynurenine formamidase